MSRPSSSGGNNRGSRRIRVSFLFNYGRLERLSGDNSDDFLYGASRLSENVFESAIFCPHPPTQGLTNDSGDVFPLPPLLTRYYLGRDVVTPVKRFFECLFAMKALNRADAIVAVNAPWVLGAGLLAKVHLLEPPVIGIIRGPFLPANSARERVRRVLERWLYNDIRLVFVGEADREAFLKYVLNRPNDCHLVFFGVDESFWHPESKVEGGDFVLSIGSTDRDYETLLRAWENQTRLLKVITTVPISTDSCSTSVEIQQRTWDLGRFSDEEIREQLHRCRYVVTPLHDTNRTSGQSVTVRAMACGKAVILTRTEGLWDKGNMQHLDNCYLVDPGDRDAIKRGVEYFESNPDEVERIGKNARETVLKLYTTSQFARWLEELLVSITSKQGSTTNACL